MRQPRSRQLTFLFAKRGPYLPDLSAGTETAQHGLCQALVQRGHRVAVACLAMGEGPTRTRVSRTLGYPVYRAARLERAVNAAARDMAPDLFVVQEPDSAIILHIRKKSPDRPLVLYFNSIYTAPLENENLRALCQSDGVSVLSNSHATSAWLSAHGIASVIVPPLFGVDRYAERHARDGIYDYATCRSQGQDVLMISTQLGKGVDLVLRLAEARPQRRFHLVQTWGPEDEIARIKRWAERLANVVWHPNTPDLHDIFRSTRLLLMPSRFAEGWGRSATEAQIFGIPVMASDRGNLPETIGAGGICLNPDGEFRPWLKAFDDLFRDQALYDRMSRAAFARGMEVLQAKERAVEDFLQASLDRVEAA